MGLIKIKGRWGVDYYANGQRMRKVIGDGKSKTLAQAALHSIKKKIAEGLYLPEKRHDDIKVSAVLDLYWNRYLKHGKSGEQAEYCIDEAKRVFGHYRVSDLRKDRIEACQRAMRDRMRKAPVGFKIEIEGKTADGEPKRVKTPVFAKVRPSTVNRVISHLSAAINYAAKLGEIRISENPCKGVERLVEKNVRDIVISEGQLQSLLYHLPEYLKPVVTFAYYTGCRKGEILNLKKADIDLFQNVVFIRDTKNDESRYIPIDSRLKETLIALLKTDIASEYLFNYKGQKILTIKKAFRSACVLAKLNTFHFHDLRHTCLTNWHNAGHSHFLIMQASGHKTISCFKRYLSFRNNDLQKLVFEKDGHLVDTCI